MNAMHGGTRTGAGRPAGVKSKTIRVRNYIALALRNKESSDGFGWLFKDAVASARRETKDFTLKDKVAELVQEPKVVVRVSLPDHLNILIADSSYFNTIAGRLAVLCPDGEY